MINHSVADLQAHLREIPQCSLEYRLYSHRKLLRTQRLIAENEVVGRYDIVAGLEEKEVTPTGETRTQSLACLGDEGSIDGKYVLTLPANPKVCIPSSFVLKELELFVPNRSDLERRMLNSISKSLISFDGDGAPAQVLSRKLKIGVHNGHTILGGELQAYSLFESQDQPDVLLLEQEAPLEVRGYVAHDLMALVLLIEYEIGLPHSTDHNHYNTKAILQSMSAVRGSNMVTSVVLGCGTYVPYDGSKVLTKNTREEDVDIELLLRNDDVCSIFGNKPIFKDNEYKLEQKARERKDYKDDRADSDAGEDEGITLSFDLNLVDPTGTKRDKHDDASPRASIDADSKQGSDDESYVRISNRRNTDRVSTRKSLNKVRSSRTGPVVRQSSTTTRARPDDDDMTVDSMVEGVAGSSNLRLDPQHYSTARSRDFDDYVGSKEDTHGRPRGGLSASQESLSGSMDRMEYGNLLSRSLQAPVHSGGSQGRGNIRASFESSMRRSMHHSPIDTAEHVRDMSRGARTRLNRHGFDGAILDDEPPNLPASHLYPKRHGGGKGYGMGGQGTVDLTAEINDELTLNEITLQFAGLQYGVIDASKSSRGMSHKPRSVYFSYQFFTCESTRTELLKLLPADEGKLCVLARDDAYARNEPPLALRYVVDTSTSSNTEATEFAEYLAAKTLHVDVWDSDSLMLLGTCGVPLRRLMRQGEHSTKCAIEVDIIDSEAEAQTHGGITSCSIRSGSNMSGKVVGSVHIILSNHGQPGKNDRQMVKSKAKSNDPSLNWRVNHNAGQNEANLRGRPKNSVRARPLSENAPELSSALREHREYAGVDVGGGAMRSLTQRRGEDSNHTLNYDDVMTLFKRFQGTVKGTVQYSGNLMNLLDVPSWGLALRKLLKAFSADQVQFEKELLRYSTAEGALTLGDLHEFIRGLFEGSRLKYKLEEVALLVKALGAANGDAANIPASKVVAYCEKEAAKQQWEITGKHMRRAVQDCYLLGVDFEQLLAEKDLTGGHHVSIRDFKEVLYDLSQRGGKLSSNDIDRAARHFSSKVGGHVTISLKEVMLFVGKSYVGNVEVRLTQVLTDGGRSLDSVRKTLGKGKQSLDHIETALSSLGLYNVLSHQQVHKVLSKVDNKNTGSITADQLLAHLKLAKAPLTQADEDESGITVESLLNTLLERVQSSGSNIVEVFRHFDRDGNGSISKEEMEEGFSRIGIFDVVPNWRNQIPKIVQQFDRSGDNSVDLKEFFQFLGITNYEADIIQSMTKIFAVAQEKGMTFDKIFEELEPSEEKKGWLNAAELLAGLKKLGTFGAISEEDAAEIVKAFHDEGTPAEETDKVSQAQFEAFFSTRVAQVSAARAKKRVGKVMIRFQSVVKRVQEKNGLRIADIFAHFDKNHDGDITLNEFKGSLKAMKHFESLTDDDLNLLLDAIDADSSGTISLTEFLSFVELRDPTKTKEDLINDRETMEAVGEQVREVFLKAIDGGVSLNEIFNGEDLPNIELSAVLEALARKHMPSLGGAAIEAFVNYLDHDNSKKISLEEMRIFVETKPKRQQQAEDDAKDDPNDTPQQKYLKKEVRRIAAADGGVEALLAYMDDRGTGLISFASFMRLLKREAVFETSHEEDSIASILVPMSSDGNISVVSLLKFMDGTRKNPASGSSGTGEEKGGDSNDVVADYEFSRDPETHSLEQKLRRLGRMLAKKGTNVEGMFRVLDRLDSGMVRRTEFISILSDMGLYILEQGRALDDQSGSTGGTDGVVRKKQLDQISKLRGPSYSNNAHKAARRYVDGGAEGGGADFKEHLESLALVNWYRQSQKKMLLQKVLSHSLASTVRLYPRFGKTLFFEQPITNPFNHEERFIIDVNDPELRVVTSFDEWLQLREACGSHGPCTGELGPEPIETDMFDRDGYGNVQVALLPHETLYVPMTFMTLVPHTENPVTNKSKRNKSQNHGGESKGGESKSDALEPYNSSKHKDQGQEDDLENEDPRRTIEVKIVSGGHGHVTSAIKVLVCPRPFVVDRTLRFFEPENSIMKRRIQLLDFGAGPGRLLPGDAVQASKFVHCVEDDSAIYGGNSKGQSNVVIEWGPSQAGGALDMILRYRCGSFPNVGSFYIILYDDPYQSRQHEVWKVVVQARQRLDVHGPVGASSLLDLVVQGDRFARRARAHVSFTTDSVQFTPDVPFQLVPGAYNRVGVKFSPRSIGTKRLQLNLVDVDSKELISSWLLTTTATAPAVMRTYDVDVANSRPVNKKIVFKNPWDVARKFTLSSSDETVMRARVTTVEVAPYGSAYLRLWFNGKGSTGQADEVFLFLNDEGTGQNEESFLFRIHST